MQALVRRGSRPVVDDDPRRQRDALLWALTISGMTLGEWTDDFEHHPECDGDCMDGPAEVLERCAALNTLRPALLDNDANHGPSLITYLPEPSKLAEWVSLVLREGER